MAPAKEGAMGQMSKKFKAFLIQAVNPHTPRAFRYITAHLTTLEKHYSQRVNISGGSCIVNTSLHSAIAMSAAVNIR